MGCGTGAVGGCQSGGCKTGGCNRMNTFDWFSGMPLAFGQKEYDVVELSFKNGARKDFFWNDKSIELSKGDLVSVEGVSGFDVGEVSMKGELVKLQIKKKKVDTKEKFPKILRLASEKDIKLLEENRNKEKSTMLLARIIARELKLNMKIGDVEYQADGKKATFYYIADERIDFRELIKRYAAEFSVKVEMKHIGARQEAARIGGIGSCGRELCCSSWLSDFPTVNTSAARYQNLSINVEKLSGQCGRLKCCLNYELDSYMDALKDVPTKVDRLETKEGIAFLRKTEILKKIMVFEMKLEEDKEWYKLPVDKVREIAKMNSEGVIPDSLALYAVSDKSEKIEKEKTEELVGQIDIKTLQKRDKKPKRHQQRREGSQQAGKGPKPTNQEVKKSGPTEKKNSPSGQNNNPRRNNRGPRPNDKKQ